MINKIFSFLTFLILFFFVLGFIIFIWPEKPFSPIEIKVQTDMDIRSNITPIIIEGFVSKDEIYFSIFDIETGEPVVIPSIDNIVSIRYIGGSNHGILTNNKFIITNKHDRNRLTRVINKDKNIKLLCSIRLANGNMAYFSFPISIE